MNIILDRGWGTCKGALSNKKINELETLKKIYFDDFKILRIITFLNFYVIGKRVFKSKKVFKRGFYLFIKARDGHDFILYDVQFYHECQEYKFYSYNKKYYLSDFFSKKIINFLIKKGYIVVKIESNFIYLNLFENFKVYKIQNNTINNIIDSKETEAVACLLCSHTSILIGVFLEPLKKYLGAGHYVFYRDFKKYDYIGRWLALEDETNVFFTRWVDGIYLSDFLPREYIDAFYFKNYFFIILKNDKETRNILKEVRANGGRIL